jgi:hypothetical protein
MTRNTNSRPGRKASVRQSFDLPLPTIRRSEAAWLREAGRDLARQQPEPIDGPVAVRIKAAIDQGGELEGIATALLGLLTRRRVIESEAIADLALRWDCSVSPGRVCVELASTTPPTQRIGAATRQRVAEAQKARWAAARAARAAA